MVIMDLHATLVVGDPDTIEAACIAGDCMHRWHSICWGTPFGDVHSAILAE